MLDEPRRNARPSRMRFALPRPLFAAAAALSLLSCGPGGEEAVDIVVIGDSAPTFTDPATGRLTVPTEVLLSNAAQGLVRFDAHGQIEPGLAERWNVSDDGLSYIFRIAAIDWPDGRAVNARDVARILNRQLRSSSRNTLKDSLGAVSEIVAMTDRVLEVRLRAPRPNLLQLLAQPAFAIVREGQGSGPFHKDPKQDAPGAIALTRTIRIVDDKDRVEHLHLRNAEAGRAIGLFRNGKTTLVLGGTFVELPLVDRQARTMRNALRFDPVAGLFGLVPARSGGPLADRQLRDLLNRAIDRDALVAALGVPNLVPRNTLLQAGLEGGVSTIAPGWAMQPLAERRAAVIADARAALGSEEPTKLAIALPEGPGADILLARLAADWRPLGIELVRAGDGVAADLKLVDEVAPSTSPAWFVRNFRCGLVPLCSEDADSAMDSARDAVIAAQRAALLAEAGRLIDENVLFLPIAAPVRWSLVGDGLPGFSENIFARHPLSGLRNKPSRERQ